MKGCLTILLLLVALFIGGVWYVFRPMTLGITYTAADMESATKKLGVIFEALPPGTTGKTLVVSGSHPVDQTFTSSELTALADNRSKQYSLFPFKNVEIRVKSDGSVEGSATVGFGDAVRHLISLGVAEQDINEAAAKFNIPNATLPVYMNVSGNVINDESRLSVHNAKIANIAVPKQYIDQYGPALNPLIDSVIQSRKPSYRMDRLEVIDGKVHFKGTSPNREQAVR